MDTSRADQALETLIHEYGKLVFHTIYSLTGDWDESQDLTQDTFHQALRSLDAARAVSGECFHAKAWLLRIALNTVRMQQRRRKIFRFIPFSRMVEGKQQTASAELLNEQAIPAQPAGYGITDHEDPAEVIAEQDAVRRTLATLPEPLRVCLLLSIVSGLSTKEIASLLQMKEAAVRQRLVRARKQFQQAYAAETEEVVLDTASTVHEHIETRQNWKENAEQQTSSETTHRLMFTQYPPITRRSYA